MNGDEVDTKTLLEAQLVDSAFGRNRNAELDDEETTNTTNTSNTTATVLL
jgi:hypothetical protein